MLAQAGVAALPAVEDLVEDLDVLEPVGGDLRMVRVVLQVDPLHLQGVERALHHCVVVALAFAAHAADRLLGLHDRLVERFGDETVQTHTVL